MTVHRCTTCARTFPALLVVDVRQGERTEVERWCRECLAGYRELGVLRFILALDRRHGARFPTAPATSPDEDAMGGPRG